MPRSALPTRRLRPRADAGQVLPFTAIVLLVLLLFVGMGVDYGYMYLVRANLSKATDAAALAGIRNLRSGVGAAENVARDAFAANYQGAGMGGRDAGPPTLRAQVRQDASDNTLMTVDASVAVSTFFLGIVPSMRQMQVPAHAETIRPKMIVSLVLDRSGSMVANGGAAALPDAVDAFMDYFEDDIDRVGIVSYASAASVDVSVTRPFKGRVRSTLVRMAFEGWTASEPGIVAGANEARRVSSHTDEEVVRSVVFFTDGLANTFVDRFDCGTRNLANDGTLYNPSTGELAGYGCNIPPSLPSVDGSSVSTSDPCDLQTESEKRTEAAALAARRAGLYVYAVALGSRAPGACGRETINVPFLQRVANDPGSTTFDATQPIGATAIAMNAGDLERVFGEIAQMVLYRLRQ